MDIGSVRFYLVLFMLSETLAASMSLSRPEAAVGLRSFRPLSGYESSEATGWGGGLTAIAAKTAAAAVADFAECQFPSDKTYHLYLALLQFKSASFSFKKPKQQSRPLQYPSAYY